jgi:hypothetical protein
MSGNPKKYAEAGRFFKQLREDSGFVTRDSFVAAIRQNFGPEYSSDQIARLEAGYKEPAIAHWLLYSQLTGCDLGMVAEIPGLLSSMG